MNVWKAHSVRTYAFELIRHKYQMFPRFITGVVLGLLFWVDQLPGSLGGWNATQQGGGPRDHPCWNRRW